ncbi:smoothened-like protein [Leptotrombidium deliense]|uniref:Smoothened-like protein n=1 Tax=Leptotrombidium deliense TaxID=299467 RepID=A0A443SAP4_9ACAR|nr:smoothened-like protein [Leptotrombidium deliense]
MNAFWIHLFACILCVRGNYNDGAFTSNSLNKACRRDTQCEYLKNNTCLDVILPYKYTSLKYEFGEIKFKSQNEVHEYLAKWKVLKGIPRCWVKLQSLLCTALLPKCDENNHYDHAPSQELCRLALSPCGIIAQNFGHQIAPFFQCNDSSLFPSSCKNEYTNLMFNSTAVKCNLPLVASNDSSIGYPEIEGCALQCEDVLYTNEEHKQVESFIFKGSLLSFMCTLFCVLTFIIDWKSSNRYPPVIIFYINICIMITNIGWLFQFMITDGKSTIVCREDKTLRYGSSASDGYCPLVFFLIYYFSMAALAWFVILAFAWDRFFRRVNSFREREVKSVAYYHLGAWCLPVILILIIIISNQIDGNSMLGICFVGFKNGWMRVIFVLIPLTVGILIGSFYMNKCMITLMKAKASTAMVSKSRVYSKIKCNVIRIGLFVLFAIGSLICTFICHLYEYFNYDKWNKALHNSIICSLNITSTLNAHYNTESTSSECRVPNRPNITYVYAQLIVIFGVGIATSSWVWTRATIASWRRCYRKKCPGNVDGPVRLKKHEVISKAWNRREAISKGCYSPSFQSVHEDPVAMNLTSAASQELSSTWANAFPNLLSRRGGITECANYNHYLNSYTLNNNQSSISDLSQQRCSFDSFVSRRDSQASLEQDLAAIVRHQRRKTKKERERSFRGHRRSIRLALTGRRGSDTSSQSIASHPFLMRAQETVTKSTSTGDLQQTPSVFPPLTVPTFPTMHMLPTQPILTSSIAHYANVSNSTYPALTPTVTHVQHQKPPKPQVLNHPFTHGMSQQSDSLVNPFEEKRRAGSDAFDAFSPFESQQTSDSIPTALPMNSNLSFGNFNSFGNYQYSQPSYPYFTGIPPFFPTQNMLSNQNNQFPNFVGNLPVFTSTPPMQQPPQFTSFPFGYQMPNNTQHSNLEDLQATIREREEFLHLIAPVDSSSEVGEFFPIHLSDSDANDAPISSNYDVTATQQLVDERIQRVEAEAAARDGIYDDYEECDNENDENSKDNKHFLPLRRNGTLRGSKTDKKKKKALKRNLAKRFEVK